jgi:hypothetical protein
MIRKRDRVVGTLAVWIGILIAMGMILDRMNGVATNLQNNWYYGGNVVTGASPEEATRILGALQSMSNDLFLQVRQFTQAELLAYLPYFALLGLILLAGGVLSTLFIWRSVSVPAQISEAIASRMAEDVEGDGKQSTIQSLANLLDDDGELHAVDTTSQPISHQRQEQA